MSLFLTFDIEDWYHANFSEVPADARHSPLSNFPQNVQRLIEICARLRIRSTCFVLGEMAEKFPDVIRALHAAGHEIASHGYAHKLVYSMTPQEFKEDLALSCRILENITGRKILGFRAPSWSVKQENLGWYYEALESLGLKYSSSVYPAHTFLYGIEGFPEQAHYPVVAGRQTTILEIPVPVTPILNRKVGYSGGFYLRFFPAFFIKHRLDRALAKGATPFIYLHPREIDVHQPKLKLSPLNNAIHYWGIRGCERKLEKLLTNYAGQMQTLESFLLQGAPDRTGQAPRGPS